MKLTLLGFFCATLFFCCQSNPTPIKTDNAPIRPNVIYTGMYMQGTEGRAFFDCSSNNLYAVKDETQALDTLYTKQFQVRNAYNNEPVFAIVQGEINEIPANNGVSANTKGILLVKKVDSLTHSNPRNCCMPYEYMAHGTEPFWSLEVYPEGKSIVFSVVGDSVATISTTPAVQILGDTKTYTTQTSNGKPLTITIKKGESNDGMSDFLYPYTVDILLGNEKFSGVGMRKGDKIGGME
jgi:uncharacterized membrane protein